MKISLNTPFQNKTTLAGLILLAISLAIFAGTANVYTTNFDWFTGVFFVHYPLTFLYLILVMIKNKSETGRYLRFPNFSRNIILLQLFNVSAYSLNRSIPVFDMSTAWVVWFLVISNGLLLAHALWRNYALSWFNHLIVAAANAAILFHFYESLYVMPGYLIAIGGFWFFGIALHIFVPALYVWAYFKLARDFGRAGFIIFPVEQSILFFIRFYFIVCPGTLLGAAQLFILTAGRRRLAAHWQYRFYLELSNPPAIESLGRASFAMDTDGYSGTRQRIDLK